MSAPSALSLRPAAFTAGPAAPFAGYNPLKTRLFGATLILLGVAATLAGMWEHRHVLRAIARVDYRYTGRPAIARFMGAALVVIGLAALVVVLIGA